MAVQFATAVLVESSGYHSQFVALRDSDTHCAVAVKASRSQLGFRKTVLVLAVMVLVVGKPQDCTVDATKSCYSCSAPEGCIAADLVVGIAIVCEQIAVDCM